MAGAKRKATRPGAHRRPLSKSLLLPMSAQSARELSLAHHLALAACRGDSANRHQINELVRSVYMAYFLQRMGFGERAFILVGSRADSESCVVDSEAGVPPFEVLAKTAVDDADSHLKQKVCTLRRPTHLL